MNLQRYSIGFFITFLSSNYSYADLRTLQGLSEAQLSLANSIHEICPKLGAKDDKTENESNLFFACRAMIQTSNAIQGEGPTTYSLDLSEAEIIDALDAIAHEESAATGSVFTKRPQSTISTIGQRLSQLRSGKINSYSGNIKINNKQLPQFIFHLDESQNSIASSLSFHTNLSYNSGDKRSSSREDAYDFNSTALLLGADYRVNNFSFIGVALSYSNTNADITSDSNTNDLSTQGFGNILYGTLHSDQSYISFALNSGNQKIDSRRSVPSLDTQNLNISGIDTLEASTSAKTKGLEISGGHDNAFNSISLSHYGRVNYQLINVGAYNESGNNPLALHLYDEEIVSFRGTIGLNLTHTGSYSFGVLTEYFRVEWLHEFKDQSRNIKASYLYDPFDEKSTFTAPTEKPDRDFFTFSIGFTSVLPMGTQIFFAYENTSGLDLISNHSVILGARWEKF